MPLLFEQMLLSPPSVPRKMFPHPFPNKVWSQVTHAPTIRANLFVTFKAIKTFLEKYQVLFPARSDRTTGGRAEKGDRRDTQSPGDVHWAGIPGKEKIDPRERGGELIN